MDESLYDGREQSLVKHLILKRYLLRFSLIIGRKWDSITYVDGFSGPWKSKSEEYKDTSFAIAVEQLREARRRLGEENIPVKLRALFIESDSDAFAELKSFADNIDDIEIKTLKAELEDSVGDIAQFIQNAPNTFPFIFIDPKGWSGFSLEVIRPLLELKPCELLVNFMTQHIVRFIDNTASQDSFVRLFGSNSFQSRLAGTKKEDRVDAAVFEYRDRVSEVGRFEFPGISAILNPRENRHHFHLVYFSRDAKGLEVFKAGEKSSMADMETARAKAEKEQRVARTNQLEMIFDEEDVPESDYFKSLRERYLRLAEESLRGLMAQSNELNYDTAWRDWLRFPMVWETDLKAFVKRSDITIGGLEPNERVPKRKRGHVLRSHVDSEPS